MPSLTDTAITTGDPDLLELSQAQQALTPQRKSRYAGPALTGQQANQVTPFQPVQPAEMGQATQRKSRYAGPTITENVESYLGKKDKGEKSDETGKGLISRTYSKVKSGFAEMNQNRLKTAESIVPGLEQGIEAGTQAYREGLTPEQEDSLRKQIMWEATHGYAVPGHSVLAQPISEDQARLVANNYIQKLKSSPWERGLKTGIETGVHEALPQAARLMGAGVAASLLPISGPFVTTAAMGSLYKAEEIAEKALSTGKVPGFTEAASDILASGILTTPLGLPAKAIGIGAKLGESLAELKKNAAFSEAAKAGQAARERIAAETSAKTSTPSTVKPKEPYELTREQAVSPRGRAGFNKAFKETSKARAGVPSKITGEIPKGKEPSLVKPEQVKPEAGFKAKVTEYAKKESTWARKRADAIKSGDTAKVRELEAQRPALMAEREALRQAPATKGEVLQPPLKPREEVLRQESKLTPKLPESPAPSELPPKSQSSRESPPQPTFAKEPSRFAVTPSRPLNVVEFVEVKGLIRSISSRPHGQTGEETGLKLGTIFPKTSPFTDKRISDYFFERAKLYPEDANEIFGAMREWDRVATGKDPNVIESTKNALTKAEYDEFIKSREGSETSVGRSAEAGLPVPPKIPGGVPKGSVTMPESLINAANRYQRVRYAFNAIANPAHASSSAELGTTVIRMFRGHAKFTEGKVLETIKGASDAFESLSTNEKYTWMDRQNKGLPQATPELQAIGDMADTVIKRGIHDVATAFAKKHGIPESDLFPAFHDHYFPRRLKHPEVAGQVAGLARKARRLTGTRNWAKHHVFGSIAEAKAHGFEPISDNPIEHLMTTVNDFHRYISGLDTMYTLRDLGYRKFVKMKDVAMMEKRGWEKEPTEMADPKFRPKGGKLRAQTGIYMLPRDIARVLRNHLSPGLWSKDWYQAYRTIGNSWNAVQLGISGFHGIATAMHTGMTDIDIGMDELVNGHPVRGLGKIARGTFGSWMGAPAAHYYLKGRMVERLMKAQRLGAKIEDPVLEKMIETNMDLDPYADREYNPDAMDARMREALERSLGKPVSSLQRVVMRTMQELGKPLFKYLIPNIKRGVLYQKVSNLLEFLPEDIRDNPIEFAKRAQREADSVDNRYGMVTKENLFWNKTFQNYLDMATRAPYWSLGTFREYAGGGVDLMKGKFSQRARFAAAGLLVWPVTSVIYQYLITGTFPEIGESWWETYRNFHFPWNGEYTADGQKARISFPGYPTKDVPDVLEAVADGAPPAMGGRGDLGPISSIIAGKAHPIVGTAVGILANRDWRNVQIADPNAPLGEKLAATGKYALGQWTPISIQNIMRRQELEATGESTSGQSIGESLLGVTMAKRKWLGTPLRNALHDANEAKLPKGAYTREQISHIQAKRQLTTLVRQGKNPQEIASLANALTRRGLLREDASHHDITDAIRSAHVTPLARDLNRASLETLLANYHKALPEERRPLENRVLELYAKSPDSINSPNLKRYKPLLLHILMTSQKGETK